MIYGEVKNTLEEVGKTRQYVEKTGLRKIILVTSESHMRRARAMFNKQDLYPDLLSVSRVNKEIRWNDFIPGKNGLAGTHGMLYEIVGYAGYFLMGKL